MSINSTATGQSDHSRVMSGLQGPTYRQWPSIESIQLNVKGVAKRLPPQHINYDFDKIQSQESITIMTFARDQLQLK